SLAEAVGPKGLAHIGHLATAQLLGKAHAEGGEEGDDAIGDSFAPYDSNFPAFAITDKDVVLYLAQGTVLGSAGGDFTLRIPLSAVKSFLRANWRAPLPSFDCARAGTAIEKSICVDVALARLDRHVADAYGKRAGQLVSLQKDGDATAGPTLAALKVAQR